ncbi:MAG: hypothetical protein K9M45_07955 [Kiritimatiellales bacterium]|nr:hypothetical protein [Kiritimatiellales bacterium]
MKRAYKKKPLLDMKRVGAAVFTLFLVFIAYKILTPPSNNLATITSPDGSKTARLRKFYYVSQPSYKVYCRDTGNRVWQALLYLPSYTNIPHQTAIEAIDWSPDSKKLFFRINDAIIWQHDFAKAE